MRELNVNEIEVVNGGHISAPPPKISIIRMPSGEYVEVHMSPILLIA